MGHVLDAYHRIADGSARTIYVAVPFNVISLKSKLKYSHTSMMRRVSLISCPRLRLS